MPHASSPPSNSPKIWFITGASKGFGHVWTEAALARGDKVAAAARTTASLDSLKAQYGDRLLPLTLDVGDKAAVDAAVKQAHKQFGHIDIAVNNAGYGQFGAIEEVSEQEARAQIETNLFGALWVTQAVLPIMRAQASGRIIQISSIGGVFAVPTVGLYHASKWGLEGFSQALAAEVKDLGIKVTIVEPGGFATEWGTTSAHRSQPLAAYDAARASLSDIRTASTPGDPKATASALFKIADAAEPPLRVFFGDAGLPIIRREYAERLADWEKWNDVALEAQGNSR
jgi:NAD(P)-dependent dehydrogenase (short-subunit alcohol dehydrogenase family)